MAETSPVLDLTLELLRRRSVTPDDAGCQEVLAERLQAAGLKVRRLRYGEVENLWATLGGSGPTLVFLGHTDVVPSGPEADWRSPPFQPLLREGYLYGRGAADMKASVAAMTVALERLAQARMGLHGRVALLLTSDEEGPAEDGVRRVAETLRTEGERIDWCVVGEPSSKQRLGDLIRVGRRGSLSGQLTVRGVQGHVAYPELANNPIHAFAPALTALTRERWDEGNTDFPPTSFQISHIKAGTGAGNVIPGQLDVGFNFRFGTASSATSLRERTEALLHSHGLDFQLDWRLSGEAFLSPAAGRLRAAVLAACQEQLGQVPEQSTGGGTSDGRFIAPLGAEVVELGPVNATIHKTDECIAVADLEPLAELYQAIAWRLLGQP